MEHNQQKNTYPLPIQKGERPLFEARNVLESLQRDLTRHQNPYLAKDSWDIMGYIAALEIVASIFSIRANEGRRENSRDLFTELEKLPLFFSPEEVQTWEVKRPWSNNNFCPYSSIINSYGMLLDSPTPSSAYMTQDTNAKHMWDTWFSKTPKTDILKTLDYSQKKWQHWEHQRPEQTLFIFNNSQILGQKLGLRTQECFSWAVFELLIHHNSYKNLWNIALKEFSHSDELFNLWEKAFNLEPNSIIKLFYEDSPLVKSAIYKSRSKMKSTTIDDIINSLQSYPDITSILYKRIHQSQDLLSIFASPYPKNNAPLSKWSYAGHEVESIAQGLKTHHLSILIHGVAGSGKSSFVSSLLNHIDKNGWIPNINDSVTNYKDKDDADSIEYQLMAAARIVADNTNILVFDGNTQFLSDPNKKVFISQYINQKKSSQIWVLEDLDKIDKDILSQFNMVLTISEMPMNHRVTLAQTHFQDQDLAFRIAQSVHTPKAILNIAAWCQTSQDYSWKNAFHYMNSMNRLLSQAKHSTSLLHRVDIDGNIPELAGYSELNDLLIRLSDYFNYPKLYQDLGAKIPKGILLMGSPGTGKTHFARHLTRNVGIPMFMSDTSKMANNPEVIEEVFNEARRHAPCILFLDEIDTLINSPHEGFSINLEKQKVLNSFLSQLDGINTTDGILVIGATHRKFNPDPAAVRAGRLGETIYLNLPNSESRQDIWRVHLALKPIDKNMDYEALSLASSSFSGAEIAEAINRAAIIAAQNRQKTISLNDILKACDDLFWGSPNSSMILKEPERYKTAIHEAGHALIAWKNKFNVNRITVRPRAQSLGAVNWQLEEGVATFNKSQLIHRIELALGGVASEQAIFNEYHNGGTSDLKYAREMLRHLLMQTGMGDTFQMSYSDMQDTPLWSEKRKEALEQEEQTILNNAMENNILWLSDNAELVCNLAQYLLKEKEISGEKLDYWQQSVQTLEQFTHVPSQASEEHHTIHRD